MATVTEKKVGYQIKTGRSFKDRAAAGRALVWGKGVIPEDDIKKIKNQAELILKYREELEKIEKTSGIGINHLIGMIKHDLADIKYRKVDPKSGLLLSVIEKQKIKEAAKKATAPESKKVTEKKTSKKGKEKSAEKNSKGAQKAPKSEENHNQEAEVKAIAAEISADLDVKPSEAES